MGPCRLHQLKNGRESWAQEPRGLALGNNGAVALATERGEAESGKRCPKKGRWEGGGCAVPTAVCAPSRVAGAPFPEQLMGPLWPTLQRH